MAPSTQYLLHTYPPAALGIGAAVLLSGIVTWYFRSWYRLRHINGPRLAPWSYLWLLRLTTSGQQAVRIRAINDKYGPLARIGPNEVLVDDPEVIRRMGAARSSYGRSNWYLAMRMDPYHDTLFSLRDTRAHDKLKAKLSFGYGGKENPALEQGIDQQLRSFVDLVRSKYTSADGGDDLRPLDLAAIIQYFTLDALTQVAYGKEFGFLSTDSDVEEYISSTAALVPSLHACAEVPWLRKILMSPLVLKYIGAKPTDKTGYGRMLAMSEAVVRDRFEPDAKEHFDMLGSFVRHGVERRDCQAEVLFQIIAGSDTTATALRGTLLNLMTTPQAYLALQREIDEAVAQGRISSPAQAEEGKGMPYLQAVIYEGLRINIPFSGLVMKEVPPEGDTIHGQFLPGGTRVAANFLGIQRSKAVFGRDADLFRPERWLDLSSEQTAQWRQHVELVFGAGRWGCSGKAVAFMELNKVYIELLRHFNFQLIDPMKPMTSSNYGIFFQKNLWVKVTTRN